MGARPQTPRTATCALIGAIQRHHGPDDPRLPELRRDLRAFELEEHIKRLIAQAPPFTDSQRVRLAALLMSGAGHAG